MLLRSALSPPPPSPIRRSAVAIFCIIMMIIIDLQRCFIPCLSVKALTRQALRPTPRRCSDCPIIGLYAGFHSLSAKYKVLTREALRRILLFDWPFTLFVVLIGEALIIIIIMIMDYSGIAQIFPSRKLDARIKRTLRSSRDTQTGRSHGQSRLVDSSRTIQSTDRAKDNQAGRSRRCAKNGSAGTSNRQDISQHL